jgi:HEAT repeat protein
MNLVVPCPQCGCKCKIGPSAIGRKVKCPRCATPLPVPSSEETTAAEPLAAARPEAKVRSAAPRIEERSSAEQRQQAERPASSRVLLIVAAAMVCLVLAAAGGGLLVWLLLPRSGTPPVNNPAPAVASNEESKQTPKEPSAEELKAQQELQAARQLSRKNLKELALAFQNHADAYQFCPPAARVGRPRNPPPGKPPAPEALLSWRVLILPWVGEDKLYREFKLDEPWDSPHNKTLLAKMPKIFAPVRGKTAESYTTYYQVFVTAPDPATGVTTPFLPPSMLPVPPPGGPSLGGPRFPASITDGTSNTFLIVEAGESVPWTKPADLEYDPKKPLPKLGGLFPEGFHAVAFDGQVHFVGRDYPEKDLRRWITCNDGEVVETELKPLSDKDEAPAAPEAPKQGGQPPKGEAPLIRGKTMEAWLKQANSPDFAARREAAKGLMEGIAEARKGGATPALPPAALRAVCRLMMDGDAAVSKQAFEILGLTGPQANETVIALLRPSGGHPEDDVADFQSITEPLIRRGGDIAPALLSALNHDDFEIRARAAALLREVNVRNRVKVPVPNNPLFHSERPKYEAIDKALAERRDRLERFTNLKPNSPQAVEAVLTLLEAVHEMPDLQHFPEGAIRADTRLRDWAIQGLAQVGPLGRVAIPDLFRPNPRPAVQIAAKMAEGKIDREPFRQQDKLAVRGFSTAQLLDRMLHPVADDSMRSALAEGRFDPSAKGAVAALRNLLKDPNDYFRLLVVRALAEVGPAAREAVPDLQQLLQEQKALPADSPGPFVGAPGTGPMRKNRDDMLSLEIAHALLRIDPGSRPTVLPVLKDYLRSPKKVCTIAAALLLAGQGVVDREIFEIILRYYTEPRHGHETGYWNVWDKRFEQQLDKLSRLDPQGQKALVEAGRPLLASADVKKRRAAAWVLAPLDPEACLPVLLEALKDQKDWSDLVRTEQTLHRLGPKAKAAFEPLAARVAKARSELFFWPNEPAALFGTLVRIDADAAIPVLWKMWRENPPKEADLSKVQDWMRTQRRMDWGAAPRAAFAELLQLGPRLGKFIPTLIADLQGKDDIRPDELLLPVGGPQVFFQGFDETGQFGMLLPGKGQDAAQLLIRMGPAAVAALQELAGHAKAVCRMRTALVLGAMKAEAKPAVPALLKLLADGEAMVRREAVDALGRIDPRDDKVAAALMALHKDADAEVRRRVVRVLDGVGPRAAPTLAEMLAKDKDVEVRRRAARVLRAGPGALPALTAALADADGEVRTGAAGALGDIGAPVLPALRQAARHKDVQVRRSAVLAFGKIGPDAPGVVAALIEAAQDRDPLTRRLAVSLLDRPGREAPQVLPVLAKALGDEDAAVRWTAAFVLEELGADAAEAVPALTQALSDPETDVRRRALLALRVIGPRAASAIGAIKKLMLEREDKEPRRAGQDLTLDAAATLLRVAADPVPLFAEVLQSSAVGREAAAAVLAHIGSRSVPALKKLTGAGEAEVRVCAIRCLGEIGSQTETTVPLLVGLLQDNNLMVRREAVSALGALGPKAKEAVGPLTKIAGDQGDLAREEAARALQRIAPKP